MSASSKNLAEAIDKAILKTQLLMANHTRKNFSDELEKEIRDFLSERFTLARMNANVDQEISLRCLWNDLIGGE